MASYYHYQSFKHGTISNIAMINLSKDTLVGKGLHREVHEHPHEPAHCIKVVVNGDQTETRREQYYYRFLQRKKIAWISLPQFHGNVETNMGAGAVFDLIRDDDGAVSKSLEYYLQNISDDLDMHRKIRSAINALKQDLLHQNIITMTLHPKNMVVRRKNGDLDCLIIDNIGTSELLPLSLRFRFFGGRKITRKWQRFIALLEKRYDFIL